MDRRLTSSFTKSLIAALTFITVAACGPDSQFHSKRPVPPQEKPKTLTTDEDSEPTLLPDSLHQQLPKLPERPPEIETPEEDEASPYPGTDSQLPEMEEQPEPSEPSGEKPPTAPAPAPAPAPSQPAPAEPSTSPSPSASPAPSPAPAPSVPAEPRPAPSEPPTARPTPEPQPETTPQPEDVPKPPKRPRGLNIPPAQHDAAIARADVKCEAQGPRMCPNEVGMLVVKTNKSLTQCTAFLVGDQLLMTNSHCVPKSLRADGADCRDRMQVFFPKTESQPAEHISCERVIRASQISDGMIGSFGSESDYALLKLTRATARGSLTVNRNGLDDELKLAFYSVTPQGSNTVAGLLQAKVCTAKQRALTTPSFVQPQAPVATVSGCAFVPGNSGSPGIDSKRQVRALLHAVVKKPVSSSEAGSKKRDFNPLALVTNIGCTDLPKDSGPLAAGPHADCSQKLTANELIRQTVAKADSKELTKLGREWRESAPKELGFEFQRNDNEQSAKPLIAPVLTCVQDPKHWGAGTASAGLLTLKFTLPNWGYRWDVDADDRLVLIPEIAIQQNATLKLSAKDLHAVLTVTEASSGRSYTLRNRYPICKSK